MPRLEIRLSDEQLAEIDRRRAVGEGRGTYVKRAAGLAVEKAQGGTVERPPSQGVSVPASSRPSRRERVERAQAVLDGDGPVPPVIAPKHWANR